MATALTAHERYFFKEVAELERLNDLHHYKKEYWTKEVTQSLSLIHFLIYVIALAIFINNNSDSSFIAYGVCFLSIDIFFTTTICQIIRKSRSLLLHLAAMLMCFAPLFTKIAVGYFINANVYTMYTPTQLARVTLESLHFYYSLYTGINRYSFTALCCETSMFFIFWFATFFNAIIIVKEEVRKMVKDQEEGDDDMA